MTSFKCRAAGAVVAAIVALPLGACGGTAAAPAASPSQPTPARPTSHPATPAAAPSTTATPAASTSKSTKPSAGNASFGIDKGGWPSTVKEATPLLQALPKELAGQRQELHLEAGADAEDGAGAEVHYGKVLQLSVNQEYITKDTPDGKPQVFTANDQLAATFGLGAVCDPSTYRGTAPSQGWDEKAGTVRRGTGMGPAVGNRSPKPVWFSCRIAEVQGEQFTDGQALGWTSGKTAWLILGDTDGLVRSLVDALLTAR